MPRCSARGTHPEQARPADGIDTAAKEEEELGAETKLGVFGWLTSWLAGWLLLARARYGGASG